MEGKDLLERLLDFHKSSYDIERPFDVDGDIYDAYAKFCVTSAKYVLVKTAELWRANCFEHTFFRCLGSFGRGRSETVQEADRVLH